MRRISLIERLELLLPAGSILGLVVFTFVLNLTAFLARGSPGIVISYISTLFLALIFAKFLKSKDEKLSFPQGKQLFFWVLTIISWGGFIFWKSAYALIGSDTNLYYAVAHSFIKGNFPPQTPWQPDLPLSYHPGTSELLGAFYFLTGLNFQFLHLFFSALFIFCAAQIIIWLLKRHADLLSFLLANLAAVAAFVSFGFIYIVWPVFPVRFPSIGSINQLILWLRDLPTVNAAIEVYGAPINLDALIYFIFHAFGLAIFLLLAVIVLNCKKGKILINRTVVCVGLAVLALVNESLFIAAFPAIFFGILFIELKEKTLSRNLKKLFFLILITILVVFFQGGMISSSIMPSSLEKSAIILPQKEDIKEDFQSYHLGQQSSKLLSAKQDWLPFRWFHAGTDTLLLISLIVVFIFRNLILFKVLFIAGLSSLLAYNLIVPKFLVANGNRFLSASFLFFSLLLCLSLVLFFEKIKRKIILRILFTAIIAWIFIPTILPPLALLSKNRFGENKLIPKPLSGSPGILWLKDNADFNERVMVLDKNAPHPSGQARALVEAGVFAPVFYGNFRVFTIEASPEYLDIAYYLSPGALEKLKVTTLLIDNTFLKTLPEERKFQLRNEKFFTKIFDSGEEKIYRIQNEYLGNGTELNGTLEQLTRFVPAQGKIYIDNEENFNPGYLRRAIIFSLRDRDIYFLPQSGVYLNVETEINSHPPEKENNYDYLVLGKNTNPVSICNCQVKLIRTGLKEEIFVWKKTD